MKIRILLITVSLIIAATAAAQTKLGVKGGLSTFDLDARELVVVDEGGAQQLALSIADAKYGIHLGFFLQVGLGNFFFQPELIFNSNTVDYRIEDLASGGPDEIRDENFQYLDLPFIVGFRTGPVRIGAGPVGHLFLSSTSDLFDFQGYDQNFDELTIGWQAGIGIDLWKLHIDARYEGNFTEFGNHIIFYGNQYSFDTTPSKLIASVGISF
jgi:hypothetical protein